MKDTISLVPQVFYDLIGRVVPGAAMLIGASLVLRDGDLAVAAISYAGRQSGPVLSILFAAALLVSHLLGVLLGAIGFAVVGDPPASSGPLAGIEPAPPTDDKPGSRESYIYDYIQLRNPAAGGRLAKLRAESHMCRVLIVGSIVLTVLYGLETAFGIAGGSAPGLGRFSLVIVVLGLTVWGWYLFHAHLRSRTQRLMANCWRILKQDESASAAGAGMAPEKA